MALGMGGGWDMNEKAVSAARDRLQRARTAVADLEKGDKLPEIETAWWSFLLAAAGIYSKLEQGAKGNGKSEAWFGRIKHIRKKDPLLSYMHHARNSEEHSLEGSTARGVGLIALDKNVEIIETGHPKKLEMNIKNPKALRAGVPVAQAVFGIRLAPVSDSRFGDTFPVPITHLGQKLKDNTVAEVARVGLQYLESLVAEAATLPK